MQSYQKQNNRAIIPDFTPTDIECQITALIQRFSELRNPLKNVIVADNPLKNAENLSEFGRAMLLLRAYSDEESQLIKIKTEACNSFINDFFDHSPENLNRLEEFFNKNHIFKYFNRFDPQDNEIYIYSKARFIFEYQIINLMKQLKPLRLIKLLNQLEEKIEDFEKSIKEFNQEQTQSDQLVYTGNNYNYTQRSKHITEDTESLKEFNLAITKEHEFITKFTYEQIQGYFKKFTYNEEFINFKKNATLLFLARNHRVSFFGQVPKPVISKILALVDNASSQSKVDRLDKNHSTNNEKFVDKHQTKKSCHIF